MLKSNQAQKNEFISADWAKFHTLTGDTFELSILYSRLYN